MGDKRQESDKTGRCADLRRDGGGGGEGPPDAPLRETSGSAQPLLAVLFAALLTVCGENQKSE